MTDEILAELAGQMRGGPPRHGTVDAELALLGGPEPGKHGYEQASYTSPGPHPFMCGNCRHYQPTEEHAGDCMVVHGPYQGLVGGQDTCRFWAAAPALLADPERPEARDVPEAEGQESAEDKPGPDEEMMPTPMMQDHEDE